MPEKEAVKWFAKAFRNGKEEAKAIFNQKQISDVEFFEAVIESFTEPYGKNSLQELFNINENDLDLIAKKNSKAREIFEAIEGKVNLSKNEKLINDESRRKQLIRVKKRFALFELIEEEIKEVYKDDKSLSNFLVGMLKNEFAMYRNTEFIVRQRYFLEQEKGTLDWIKEFFKRPNENKSNGQEANINNNQVSTEREMQKCADIGIDAMMILQGYVKYNYYENPSWWTNVNKFCSKLIIETKQQQDKGKSNEKQ